MERSGTGTVLRTRAMVAGAYAIALLPTVLTLVIQAAGQPEGDVYWETRAGTEILSGSGVIRPDTWSWTSEGETWTPNSWGWNVLLGLAWNGAGFVGIGALGLVSTLVLYGLVAWQAAARGATAGATGLACMALLPLTLTWLSPRPQLGTYAAALLVLALLPAALREGRQRALALGGIAAVQVVAINLHLGAVSIVPLAAAAVAAWWLHGLLTTPSAWAGQAMRGALPLAALAVASCLSSVGPGIVAHSLFVRDASTALIEEWAPGWSHPIGIGSCVVALAAAAIAWRRERPLAAGAALAAAVLTLLALRFSAVAVLLALPELAAFLSSGRVGTLVRSRWTAVAGVVVAAVLLVPALGAAARLGEPSSERFSVEAVEALPSGCRLLNSYRQGGLVVLLRPDVKVSVDGRNDLHGVGTIREQLDVVADREGTDGYLTRNRIDCLLLDSEHSTALKARLAEDSRWAVRYDDGERWVLVRSGDAG